MVDSVKNIAISPSSLSKPITNEKVKTDESQVLDDGWLDIKPVKIDYTNEGVGLFAGISTFFGVKKVVRFFTTKFVDGIMTDISKLPNDKSLEIADDMLKGFKEKGLRYELVTEENAPALKKKVLEDFTNSKFYKFYDKVGLGWPVKKLNKMFLEKAIDVTLSGDNAFYTFMSNLALAPKDKPGLLFHELGHGINFNKTPSKTLKMLIYGLPFMLLGTLAVYPLEKCIFAFDKNYYQFNKSLQNGIIDAEKKRLQENGGSQKELDELDKAQRFSKKILNGVMKFNLKSEKVYDWIKNNIGKLMLISFIPMLIEEGSASLRGIKAASGKLNPKEMQILKKSYGKAFSTYCIATVVTTCAAKLGVYVRDRIVSEDNKNVQESIVDKK